MTNICRALPCRALPCRAPPASVHPPPAALHHPNLYYGTGWVVGWLVCLSPNVFIELCADDSWLSFRCMAVIQQSSAKPCMCFRSVLLGYFYGCCDQHGVGRTIWRRGILLHRPPGYRPPGYRLDYGQELEGGLQAALVKETPVGRGVPPARTKSRFHTFSVAGLVLLSLG